MKELSIEEKAKRYDEAVEKAEERYNEEYASTLERSTIAHIFPELKESEDEWIRKALIQYLHEREILQTPTETRVKQEWIAWLEKQGEKKSIEINDEWIEKYWQHEKVNNPDSYNNGDEIQFDHDGFVRFCKMYCQKHYEQKPNFCHHEVDFSNCSEEYRKAYYDGWNNCNQQHEQMKNLQKSTWSEEDERIFDSIIEDVMPCGECPDYPTDEEIEYFYEGNRKVDWLKSLKERLQPQRELSEDITTNDYIDLGQPKGRQWKSVNEDVDLGLPSGTIWKSINEEGYYTYDEATKTFGSKLPTKEQWVELKDKCKWEWFNNGYKVIGPNGKFIFLPAAGIYNGVGVNYRGTDGYYWSSTYFNDAWNLYFDDDNLYFGYGDCDYGRSVRLVK